MDFYNKDDSTNWALIGTTIVVVGAGVLAGNVLSGQIAKTEFGKKLLAIK